MVAIEVLLLLQVPPGVKSASSDKPPGHKEVIPEIDDGAGFTITVLVTWQPVGNP